MELNDYQNKAIKTAIYPDQGANLIYAVLALAGEAGELANKIKKLMRSYGLKPGVSFADCRANIMALPQMTKDQRKFRATGIKIIDSLLGELGGVLWYTADAAFEMHTDLDTVGMANLDELSARVKTNTQEGEGDDRGLESMSSL